MSDVSGFGRGSGSFSSPSAAGSDASIGVPASINPASRSASRWARARRRSSRAAAFFAFPLSRWRFPKLSGMPSTIQSFPFS